MPGIAVTDDEYKSLLLYLKALNRDGTEKPDANQPTPGAGNLAPTVQPTTNSTGPVQPQAPGSDANPSQPVVPATPSP